MRHLILISLCFALARCGDAGGGGSSSHSPVVVPSTPVSVDFLGGHGWSCAHVVHGVDGQLYCRGVNATLGLNAAVPALTVELKGRDFDALAAWDSTLCWQAVVASRPVSRDHGVALYCIGAANLTNYLGQVVVFSGPNYVDAVNGSSDLTYAITPFMGMEGLLLPSLSGVPMITDSVGFVTASTEACTTDGVTVDCPSFSFLLQ